MRGCVVTPNSQRAGPLAAQLEDTDGMNRERAETFLRLMAEAELRHVTTHPRSGRRKGAGPGLRASCR